MPGEIVGYHNGMEQGAGGGGILATIDRVATEILQCTVKALKELSNPNVNSAEFQNL